MGATAPTDPDSRDRILAVLGVHRDELRRFGVERLELFGSVARGEERAESDIDLLVEIAPPDRFRRYMDLKEWLEELFGAHVDLVMVGALKPWACERVQREAIRVA